MSTAIDDLWQEIDRVDNQISKLFAERMALVLDIAKFKEQNNLPVLNATREREILERVTAKQNDEIAEYLRVLFTTIFDVSRSYQSKKFLRNSSV